MTWELLENGGTSQPDVPSCHTNNNTEAVTFKCALKRLKTATSNPFDGLKFRRIVADRDIMPETDQAELTVQPNGSGTTNAVARYLNCDWLPSGVVEEELLGELNCVFFPDASYKRISVQQRKTGEWEIHLDEPRKGRIRLSQTGSGLKTVLLVLVNLVMMPKIVPAPLDSFLFGFEELENNLHPAAQRRLFRYLRERAERDKCHFFLTTHSNVVIDLFSADPLAQILHVTHDGETATVAAVESFPDGGAVLDDLDVRASDLLQTNVVVWVEGPSDRIYFNRWIELWTGGKVVEGVHYQCLTYGGSAGSHLSFSIRPEDVDAMIPALKVNRHAIVLIDSDKRCKNTELRKEAERMKREIESEEVGGVAWVTAGREIENYITAAVFQKLPDGGATVAPGEYDDVFVKLAESVARRSPSGKKVDTRPGD